MDLEYFKPINGYEGLYSVSNYGRVYSHYGGGRFLIDRKNKLGYMELTLCKDTIREQVHVHRLVALTFVSGYFKGAIVNHIDFNKSNNHVNNLEWATYLENTHHSIERIRKAIHEVSGKEYVITYPCGRKEIIKNLCKFCRENNLKQGNLHKTVRGLRKHHKGFSAKLLKGGERWTSN